MSEAKGSKATGFRIKESEFLISVADPKKLPTGGLTEIAFVGRSNVGKSSLINLLLGRKALAKVSGKPGKTRLINYFTVNNAWYMVDLPGYGFAKTGEEMRRDWARMIEGYLLAPRRKLVVQLIDIRHRLSRLDASSLEWLAFHMVPTIVVLTKADKLGGSARQAALLSFKRQLKPYGVLQVISSSTQTRSGRDELLDYIGNWIRKEEQSG